MRTILRHIVSHTYKPWLVRYLSATRVYRHRGLRLTIPPQVFHPGFFFSTRILNRYLQQLPLEGKLFLELGAGSGLIAMEAARSGARVTATDINPVAIRYLHENSIHNNISLEIIHSDLFTAIPQRAFDIIAINPPYYKKKVQTLIDHAWFCGEQGEYFTRLFSQLRPFLHPHTLVIMIACEGCDTGMIRSAAARHGFLLRRNATYRNLLEKNFIFTINPAA